jgi:hypothetical protein
MVILGVTIVAVGIMNHWAHWVLFVEATEIALFALFWVIQTFDQEKRIPHSDQAATPRVLNHAAHIGA